MEKRAFQAPRLMVHLLVPLLMSLTAIWIFTAPPAKTISVAKLKDMPASLKGYSGSFMLYCQNGSCRKSVVVRNLNEMDSCPSCGGRLMPISKAEYDILPRDTTIFRSSYRSAIGLEYVATVVISGVDQRSIHRPQQCLPAQGFCIDSQEVKTLSLPSGRNIDVVVIQTRKGSRESGKFGFVYWFVGPNGEETTSHYTRLLLTLRDKLLRNGISRWAYVSVIATEPLETPESLQRLSNFLNELLPEIEPSRNGEK